MKSTDIEIDPHLKELLNRLRKVSPLDAEAVANEREKFLAQGEAYRLGLSQQPGQGEQARKDVWAPTYFSRRRIPMLNALVAVVLAIVVLFGVAGATVYAAQGSLPDETLYPVKTWSEDARLSLAGSTQAQLDLILDFTDRRVAEISRLIAASRLVPEGVAARFQDELDDALQLAAGMDDLRMVKALSQIRTRAEIQSRSMSAWKASGLEQGDRVLARLQERLQEQLRLAAAGEADPQGFRLQLRERLLIRLGLPSQTPGATPNPTGSSYGPGSNGRSMTGTPGSYGPGVPNSSRTPLPTGSSYGPGPGAGSSSATPAGYGPGPTSGSTTRTPTPGGSGPGPGANPSQTPQSGGPVPGSNPTRTSQPGGFGPGSPDPTPTPQPGGTGDGNRGSPATPQHHSDS